MAGKLDGKVAIVTGSGRGIGAAIARKLASEGAAVVVNDLDEAPAAETLKALRSKGGKAIAVNGDVAARVAVRFEEVLESLDLCRKIIKRLPEGQLAALFPSPPQGSRGVGWVEGWRGEVLIALEAGADGALHRVHPHDPSWQNWPLLEHAVIGNIVPDFPLINKSFNLSYSGHDL